MMRNIEYFFDSMRYRKAGFTVSELEHAIQVPTHQLSAFINQQHAKNFNELINSYRVNYLIECRMHSEDFVQYTFEASGKEAGINSRVAFIAKVKKTFRQNPFRVVQGNGKRGFVERFLKRLLFDRNI